MDVYSSMVAVLGTGFIGGLLADMLRLPRVTVMILLGIALSPALSPAVLTACASEGAGAVAPAAAMRSFALLVALARGGLTMSVGSLRALLPALAALATLPYLAEMSAAAAAAWLLLPAATGVSSSSPAASPLLTFMSAALWAPLSPSVVVPSMLGFLDDGLRATGGLVLSGAPVEVATALLTVSVLFDARKALVAADGTLALTLGLIPVQVFGSVAYGCLGAALFYAYNRARLSALATRLLGARAGHEPLLAFLIIYLAVYATCEPAIVPRLIGLLAALSMAVAVQLAVPALVPDLTLKLKVVWQFAECLLFVLTGTVVYGAIVARSAAFSGQFLAVLLIGTTGRLLADLVVAAIWQALMSQSAVDAGGGGSERAALVSRGAAATALLWPPPPPRRRSCGEQARLLLRRAAFLWSATMPKATLQASLGARASADAAALGISAATGAFIAESCAVAILYMALAGSVLTATLGRAAAAVVEAEDAPRLEAASARSGKDAADVGFSAELEAVLRGEQLPAGSAAAAAAAAATASPVRLTSRMSSRSWGAAAVDNAAAADAAAATAAPMSGTARSSSTGAGAVPTARPALAYSPRSQVW